jgi:mannose-6-phosphate isomerase-like protein (cupin superfamily)
MHVDSLLRSIARALVTIALLSHQALFAQATHPHPHDAAVADPAHHKLLLENESVRVFETRIAPGERTPVHSHPWPAALYVLSWSDFVRYDANGKVLLDSRTMSTQPKSGAALWSAPVGPHSIHNVGTSELLVIAVEIKPSQVTSRSSER